MKIPLQVTFRDMSPSDAVSARIEQEMERLDSLFGGIMACRVLVESPHRHHHKGNLFHVRVDLTVAGGEIVAGRDPAGRHAHEDVYVAIRDTFRAVRRRLEDYARKRRGHVKWHVEPNVAVVARTLSAEGYGFLQTAEGREIYFHENSVLDGGFESLEPGSEVRFVEAAGEKGPQASSVWPLRARRQHAA